MFLRKGQTKAWARSARLLTWIGQGFFLAVAVITWDLDWAGGDLGSFIRRKSVCGDLGQAGLGRSFSCGRHAYGGVDPLSFL